MSCSPSNARSAPGKSKLTPALWKKRFNASVSSVAAESAPAATGSAKGSAEDTEEALSRMPIRRIIVAREMGVITDGS